jgi:hypothetical protein
MIDVAEILVHWHAGRSLSEMSGSLGVDPQDAAQVHRAGGGGRDRPGRACKSASSGNQPRAS